ncbi:Metalloprotease [Coniophora puteana RWD-64-598 SS2]|uniref:Metalloprotease n=1 Tax=Coniophora puteana (strain RWD-64-598) TaxID=741705 RepID=A0A5M3N321_CONPW|nr:Metalloprotease [Coniophora puteana RWD-64-598 SS2]EIW85424.1 Metalloprotease [Coniophora puteana RWD-64-598 SS2]
MAERDNYPRPSTDQEHAPLLHHTDEDYGSEEPSPTEQRNLAKRLTDVVQEPLTGLTKVLLVEVLILLLIASVFIGLFAGAQHKLNLNKGGSGGGGDGERLTITQTDVVTRTQPYTTTATKTSVLTTTDVSTSTYTTTETSVSTSTSTQTKTTTVILGPEPTGPPSPAPPSDVCATPDCIILSASILSALDTTQDPCENFFEFANGNWIESHPIPGDKSGVSSFSQLSDQNLLVLRKILEDDKSLTDSYDDQLLLKLRTLYGSCMDETKLNYIGQEPLQNVVDTIRKLYSGSSTAPGVDDAKANQGLSNALAYVHSRGVGGLFEFSIDGDVGVDPDKMTLWFNQPSLGLPAKEYYKERAIIEVYQGVIERLLLTLDGSGNVAEEQAHPAQTVLQLGDNDHNWPSRPWPPWDGDGNDGDSPQPRPKNPRERARQLSRDIVHFEAKIAEASLDLDKLQQDPFGTYNPMEIYRLKNTLQQINFPDYFATFTPRAYPTRVIVTYPPYASSLSDILDRTPDDVIENYLVVRAALEYAPDLGQSTEAWQAVRTLQETLGGLKKGAVGERSDFCMNKVEESLGFGLGLFFVNETFGGNSKEKATNVIEDVIETFKESLRKVQWMDKKSSQAAADKADALDVKVGYPVYPDTLNPRSILSYYSRVTIHIDTFFENMLSASESETYRMWQRLGKQRDHREWEMYPSTVNAYYNPPANEIVFPAGILQPPFFSKNWPGYLSFGSFGAVAAHELTHAFDSAGRLYNQHGKLEEWWTPETSAAYQVHQDCIVKQYSEYVVEDGKGGYVHVNGNLTSGENIGDSGLINSYRAWKAQYQDALTAGNEYLLPGLDYTREQLFFISWARTWAQNNRAADKVKRVRSDPHSPNKYRAEGTVSNIPEFAKAFKCSAKAKLNPPDEKRCMFWS